MSHGIATNTNDTSVRTIKLVAAAARSKGDPVTISTGNATEGVSNDASLADNTNVYRVAVALGDAASGDVYEAAVEGTVDVTVPSGTYTAGNGLHIINGAVADSSAAAEDASGEAANNDFAIVRETGTTVTTVKATLFGFAITGQT